MWNTVMWNVVIGGSYCITGTIEREGREGVLIKDPVGRAAHVTRAPYSNANVFQLPRQWILDQSLLQPLSLPQILEQPP